MKHYIFLFFLLACSHPTETTKPKEESKTKPAPTKTAGCDMSSDEAIKKLYLKLKRLQFNDKDCIHRPSSFPGFARVGPYRNDLGCRYETFIFQCELVGNEYAAVVMAASGWSTGDPEKKQKLALDWLVQIEGMKPLNPATNTDDAALFKSQGKSLPAPEFESTSDGGVKVRFWIKINSGTKKEVLYKRHEFVFGADGTKVSSTILSSFSLESQ